MNAKDTMAQDRTEWAEERTDWAEDRTLLAAERTFAGWVRTGLAILLVAIALQGVFGPAEPVWIPKAVVTLLIVAALYVFVSGWIEARRNARAFTARNAAAQPMGRITVLTVLLVAATLSIGVVLWLI